MNSIKERFNSLRSDYRKTCIRVCEWGVKHPNIVCAAVLTAYVAQTTQDAFAQNNGNPLKACQELLSYIEGVFASLVAAAAGLGAIIASAVGGFKAAWGLLVVSIGAFILRSFIGVFLAQCK